jgi:hypothetical protein
MQQPLFAAEGGECAEWSSNSRDTTSTRRAGWLGAALAVALAVALLRFLADSGAGHG